MAYLLIIVGYSIAQIALGVWVARRLKGSRDFFVAGRSLGPGLIFATFLAATIGRGATIGATGRGYRDGLAGFALALPLVLRVVGGLDGLHAAIPAPEMWNPWRNGESGWIYLAMLGPNFIVSPGLLQKVYGARDDRAVRLGVGLNALCLMVYAPVPVLLGLSARVLHPGLPNYELALPMLFTHALPFWVGALGLAAVFSAEVCASDAIPFMVPAFRSHDLYQGFAKPAASDRQVVTVARGASLVG